MAASVRANGIGFIQRVAGSAGGVAKQMPEAVANARHIEPTILPATAQQLDDLNKFLAKPIVWANDMNCFAKANVSTRHINEVLGRGLTPVDDAYHAGIAILPAPPTANGWSFHAGVVVRDEQRGLVVIDHLTPAAQKQPLELEAWGKTYGVPLEKIRVVTPWSGTAGVMSESTPAASWSWIKNALTKTWNEADTYNVTVGSNG